MINLNDYLKDFNPIKEDPKITRTQEMCKNLLIQINKTIKELYEKENKKAISNYPTEEMIKFTSTNEISTLSMSNVLSLIYDEPSECIILSDILYDEHQRGIKSDEFNSLILWTRIFSKQNMIELKEHDKDNKLLSYKVLDKRMIDNLQEYNKVDLEEIKKVLSQVNLDKATMNTINKYNEDFIRSKSDKEIQDLAEKDCTTIIQNMFMQISSILQKESK